MKLTQQAVEKTKEKVAKIIKPLFYDGLTYNPKWVLVTEKLLSLIDEEKTTAFIQGELKARNELIKNNVPAIRKTAYKRGFNAGFKEGSDFGFRNGQESVTNLQVSQEK